MNLTQPHPEAPMDHRDDDQQPTFWHQPNQPREQRPIRGAGILVVAPIAAMLLGIVASCTGWFA